MHGIATDLVIRCGDGGPLNPDCQRVRIEFAARAFKDCNNRSYTVEDIKKELVSILSAKTWILPAFRFCDSHEQSICLETNNVPEIRRRLKNLYMRFGWSKNKSSDQLYGSGPYCLEVSTSDNGVIRSGVLRMKDLEATSKMPTEIRFFQSSGPQGFFNIALYGNSELLGNERVNVPTNTPLGYYVVSNPSLSTHGLPWNTETVRRLIKSHLDDSALTYHTSSALDALLPTGKKLSNIEERSMNQRKNLVLAIPDYLPGCDVLTHSLDIYWRQNEISATARCMNTSALAEDIAKRDKKDWDAFLTPISPGAPVRDSVLDQYFSQDSRDSWVRQASIPENYFYLVGIGQSLITLDGKRFCGLKTNPLGLGDVFVTDFVDCKK